jgi:hypothetical protein
MCCFSQLSFLAEQLGQLIRIDPFGVLPSEVSLKVLAHLDATSLCRAAQVSCCFQLGMMGVFVFGTLHDGRACMSP